MQKYVKVIKSGKLTIELSWVESSGGVGAVVGQQGQCYAMMVNTTVQRQPLTKCIIFHYFNAN